MLLEADQRAPAGLVELLVAPRAGNEQRRQHRRWPSAYQCAGRWQHASTVEVEQQCAEDALVRDANDWLITKPDTTKNRSTGEASPGNHAALV